MSPCQIRIIIYSFKSWFLARKFKSFLPNQDSVAARLVSTSRFPGISTILRVSFLEARETRSRVSNFWYFWKVASEKLNAFLDEDLPESNQSNQKLRNLEQEFQIYEKSYQKSENLKKLEKALLTIKPSSVESERIFSSVGRIVTKFRTRLSDDLPLKKREIFEKNETRFLEKITSRLSFLEFFTRREKQQHYTKSLLPRSF